MNTFEEIKEKFEAEFEKWTQSQNQSWLKKETPDSVRQIKILAYDWFCAGIWAEKEDKKI